MNLTYLEDVAFVLQTRLFSHLIFRLKRYATSILVPFPGTE